MKTEREIEKVLSGHSVIQEPLEITKTIYAIETYQKFLFEQKRIEEMVFNIINNGGVMTESELLIASQKLDTLVWELQKIIEQCKE